MRILLGHLPKTSRQLLQELVDRASDDFNAYDFYGKGGAIESLEAKVATILGKPAALFMPSGTMAQQIALRIHADQKANPRIGLHVTSHLELHEQLAYRKLHHLEPVFIGSPHRALEWRDLESLDTPNLAAIALELPTRELGGTLPSWNDLTRISDWARAHSIALHMDGARLWECQPYYDRPHSAIAALFESVYVSFYKGLGAISGAALAGAPDFIDEARIWLRRHGGNLFTQLPTSISATRALELRLPKMAEYYRKARELADILRTHPAVAQVTPNEPQSNMFHIQLRATAEQARSASLALAERMKVRLGTNVQATEVPGISRMEFTVGDATLEFTQQEASEILHAFLDQTQSQ